MLQSLVADIDGLNTCASVPRMYHRTGRGEIQPGFG